MKFKLARSFLALAAATSLVSMAQAGNYQHKAAQKDIVDTAISAGSFNTLVKAVQAAGLVETLKSDGPFTVFAPTDAAFAKLPKDKLDALLADKQALAKVLTYHVVSGKIMSGDIAGSKQQVATVEGSKIEVDAMSGVKINDANVVKADIATSNGVIHVIDTVIIPKS